MNFADQALCVQVNPDERCPAELGDGRKSYRSQFYALERNGIEYVVLGRTHMIDGVPTGNHESVPYDTLKLWIAEFGIDGIIPIEELPEEVV